MQEEKRRPSVSARPYKWPESDAEFLRSLLKDSATATATATTNNNKKTSINESSYMCRQAYLRSYKFTTKESVPERMQKCIAKVKDFPSSIRDDKDVGSTVKIEGRKKKKKSSNNNNNKGCVGVREGSSTGISSMFRRLLSCTTNMDDTDATNYLRGQHEEFGLFHSIDD